MTVLEYMRLHPALVEKERLSIKKAFDRTEVVQTDLLMAYFRGRRDASEWQVTLPDNAEPVELIGVGENTATVRFADGFELTIPPQRLYVGTRQRRFVVRRTEEVEK